MGRPLRLALVGTGGRGQIYVDVVRRLPPGRAEWSVMCDRNADVLGAFCSRNGLEVVQLHDAPDVVGRDDVDAVLICTPDHAHRDPAVTCLEAGLHTLVEKPLATDPEDAEAICTAARESGKLLHLGFVLRYDPCVQKLRELVAGGAIGKPIACLVHEAVGWFHAATYMRRWNRFRKYSGDLLLHKGCHTLDLINFVSGTYPQQVSALGGAGVFVPRADAAATCDACPRTADCLYCTDQGEAYRERFYNTAGPQVLPEPVCVYNTDKDTTDTVTLVAEYANGMRLAYTMTMVSPRGERRLVFVGTAGEIRCDLSSYRIEITPIPDQPTETIEVSRPAGTGHQHHDLALLTHFLDRIRDGADPEAGILDARMSGAVAFAALQSIDTGQNVRIPQ